MDKSIIDILLDIDPPQLPEKEIKIKRLSEISGAEIIFKLRALPYSRVADIKKLSDDETLSLNIVLAGVISPNLKDSRLCEKYNAATPAELLRGNSLLLPGEIEDIAREIEKLSGFRKTTIEEIKKNLTQTEN